MHKAQSQKKQQRNAQTPTATTYLDSLAPLNINTAPLPTHLEAHRNKKSQIPINRTWLRRRVMKGLYCCFVQFSILLLTPICSPQKIAKYAKPKSSTYCKICLTTVNRGQTCLFYRAFPYTGAPAEPASSPYRQQEFRKPRVSPKKRVVNART